MPSLVDKLRHETPVTHKVVVVGVDPDLDTVGWAHVYASYTTPSTGRPIVSRVVYGLVCTTGKKLKGTAQTARVVERLRANGGWISPSIAGTTCYVYIEGQQVYADPDAPRQVLVSKANDLLRLAEITGAAHAMALVYSGRARVLLPVEWKGQAKKEAMHDAAAQRLNSRLHGVAVVERVASLPGNAFENSQSDHGLDLNTLPAKYIHAMDALCLALVGLDRIAAGIDT